MKKRVVASISAIMLGTGLLFGVSALASETKESSKSNEVKVQNAEVSAVGEDISDDITSIKSEGFDIALPTYAPSNANQVISAYKKDDGPEVTVSHLGNENDKENHKWKIKILQEKLPHEMTKEKAIQVIEERYNSKSIEKIDIGEYQAILDYTSDKGEELNEVWIATDDYFYSIGAPYLKKEELINVASSIEFE